MFAYTKYSVKQAYWHVLCNGSIKIIENLLSILSPMVKPDPKALGLAAGPKVVGSC